MRQCKEQDCMTAAVAKGYCGKHYARLRRYGDTSVVNKPGLKKGDKRKEFVGYAGAHRRVRMARGNASAHTCECGSPAQDWSYMHTDPDDIETLWNDYKGASQVVRYSLNVDHYEPLCKPCHVTKDKNRVPSG